jgi:MFS family permease
MLGVGGVTFLAGLLFGYDQGVISGALPLLKEDLGLSTLEGEIITSWVTLGALFGALIAGGTADRIGRRWTAVAAGILFAGGALIEKVSPGAALLTVGRVVTGVGVGFASVVAPLYAAEMSPKWLRGRFVSTYQLAITVGIFLAYLADDALTSSDRWRLMFALAVIPGVALAIGFLVMPESARWLLKMGRRDQARSSAVKVGGPETADQELATIEADLQAEASEGEASWGEVFSPVLRRALWVGLGVSLAAVGVSFATLSTSAASEQHATTAGIVTVIALVVFIASFAFSMGPIVWTMISEIYPNRVRGRAISVATAVNWFAAFLVAQFFLSIVDAIGESSTFFVFSLLCVVTFVFVWFLVPETKGRSLEEIQERWVRGGDRMLEEQPLA